MYKVYRKYKKNGFQNTLKMAKMCSLRGTVRPFIGVPMPPCQQSSMSSWSSLLSLSSYPYCLTFVLTLTKPFMKSSACFHLTLYSYNLGSWFTFQPKSCCFKLYICFALLVLPSKTGISKS